MACQCIPCKLKLGIMPRRKIKKTILFALFIFLAGAALGQEFTFQGLPWGSTREQVIEKLGEPSRIMLLGIFEYDNVRVAGYNAFLTVYFRIMQRYELALKGARYQFAGFQNSRLLQEAYNDLRLQLISRYGEPSTSKTPFFYYWDKNDFYVSLIVSEQNMGIEIEYYPDAEWEAFTKKNNIDLGGLEL
jgi:hypothetical protein